MDNVSCASQIGMQMYRHYRYTGDKAFLEAYALPVMEAAADYYLDILEKGEDGRYHTHSTTCYEGALLLNDTVTDKTMIRVLFSTLLHHTDDPERAARYTDVLENLCDYEMAPLSLDDDWDGERILYGVGAGKKPVGRGEIFTIGYDDDGVRYRKTYGNNRPVHPDIGEAAFPDAELAPLYPAGILGLKDRGTQLYECLQNQLYIHPYTHAHWGMLPIFLARMGMAEEFLEASHRMVDVFQHFPCGFNVENDGEFVPVGKFLNIYNTENGYQSKLRHDDFVHFDFETVPVLAQGLTDALLQSHEGCIRICPAIRAQDEVSFTLFAEGGFAVHAEVSKTSCLIAIDSLRGEPLYVSLPAHLHTDALYAYRASESSDFTPCNIRCIKRGEDCLLDFSNVQAGETVLLLSQPIEAVILTESRVNDPNQDMKQLGRAYLGLPHLLG